MAYAFVICATLNTSNNLYNEASVLTNLSMLTSRSDFRSCDLIIFMVIS